MKKYFYGKGFTLIEVLIVMILFGLIAALAVSGWDRFVGQKKLRDTMITLSESFKLAHSESIKRRSTITISFRSYGGTSPSWCYGLSDSGDCDCRVANACTVDGVQVVKTDADFPTTMAISNFSGPNSGKYIQFEGIRGTASQSGTVQMSYAIYSGNVQVNAMGFVTVCSDTIVGMRGC